MQLKNLLEEIFVLNVKHNGGNNMYTVHTKPGCNWCVKAIELLNLHKIQHTVTVYQTPEEISEFKSRGFKTFPQIYNSQGLLIGGYDSLENYLGDDNF